MNRSGYRRTMRGKLLGLAAGAAIGVAVLGLWAASGTPGSLLNRWNALQLPDDLRSAFFLYQGDGGNAVLTHAGGSYESVSLGTTLPTTYLARRGPHLASVQLGERGRYEVRSDATLVHASNDLTTSAAVSPSGARAAFAQSDRAAIEAAHAARLARYASRVFLIDTDGRPQLLGDGFSPFFVTEDEVAWFSDAGLMRHNLVTGDTVVLSTEVRPFPPPYPAPAVSPDGRTIAWVTPETGTIHIGLVGDAGVSEVATHEGAKGPTASLSAQALYVLEHAQKRTTVWRYGLASGSAPAIVPGLPHGGRIIQLVP